MTSVRLSSSLLRILTVIIGCSAGCERVFQLDRVADELPCGDGVLLALEECDDGSIEAGDGCGPTCEIEPAFECRAPNEPCLPVVGLSRDPTIHLLEAAGDIAGEPSGGAFEFTCPPGDVLIGFEGYANGVGDNLGRLQAVCGALELATDGTALLTRTTESEVFGGSQTGSLQTAICAPDEVATGFVPTTNTYVSGFQWLCQPLAHTGGALQFAVHSSLPFGPSVGTEETKRSCLDGEVVVSVFGKAGYSIDSMGLGCSAISTVLCGDGELAAPEKCDDGNLTPGDGCGRRCQPE